jgi:hypothetical protein
MMNDQEDRFDEFLREVARDYNAPPDTPRAELWERISAERTRRRAGTGLVQPGDDIVSLEHRRKRGRPWLRFAVGVAALLALGIGIGRYTALSTDVGSAGLTPTPVPTPAPSVAAGPAKRDPGEMATEFATTEHLNQAETFLTEFGTRETAPEFSAEARDLLGTTRLLLDSKRVTDPRTRKLLEDLELVLVQIATLNPRDRREELDFIAEGLSQNHLRTRLRNAIPTGPAIRM